MSRLLVHVEGQTEEQFVSEVLRPYLLAKGYHSVSARIVGNARQRTRRGGIKPWASVRRDIIRHLKEDSMCIATTMIDYYGLPALGDGAWPGRAQSIELSSPRKAESVETAILHDIREEFEKGKEFQRFIPFVVMHEFEGLLFSDCASFSRGIGRPDLEKELRQIRELFGTPEDINDSPQTAPSKRILKILRGYEKPLLGTLAALEIGLDRIRTACPNFNRWLERLVLARA